MILENDAQHTIIERGNIIRNVDIHINSDSRRIEVDV